jgi:hypothetical protein
MPRIPIFRLGKEAEKPSLPVLVAATPLIALERLAVGVDNLRHDVALSPRFIEAARAQIMRLIVRYGGRRRRQRGFRGGRLFAGLLWSVQLVRLRLAALRPGLWRYRAGVRRRQQSRQERLNYRMRSSQGERWLGLSTGRRGRRRLRRPRVLAAAPAVPSEKTTVSR